MADLIAGAQLSAEQRAEVLAAFTWRWLARHLWPTDEAWIHAHAFYFEGFVPSEWKIALAWREAFLRSGDEVKPLDPQTVCYAIADAMMLRRLDELLETPAMKDGTS